MMKLKWILPVSIVTALALFGGCSSKTGSTVAGFHKSTFDPATANDAVLDGKPITVAGITFTATSAWNDLGASGMRSASYTFGPVEGDSDSATLAVFYFGKSSGGGVMDNIERWIGQMKSADGKDLHETAAQQEITIDDMTAHVVEVAGTYSASAGGMMSGPTIEKPNYRMTAVVLEAPEGNVFFKLTGPLKTAQKMTESFAAVLLHVKKSAGKV